MMRPGKLLWVIKDRDRRERSFSVLRSKRHTVMDATVSGAFGASLLACCTCFGVLLWLTKPDARLRHLPSPASTLPLLGNTLDLMVFQLPRLHDWIAEECERHNGRPWRLEIPGLPPRVVVSSVQAFKDIMKTQFDVFEKGPRLNVLLEDIAGQGIIAVDGDQWKAQRKVLTHLFTIRAFRETIMDSIKQHVRVLGRVLHQQMKTGEPLDLGKTSHRFTFDTFAQIGFGLERNYLAEGQDDELVEALDGLNHGAQLRFVQPAWLWRLQHWFKLGNERVMARYLGVLDKVVFDIVRECLRSKEELGAKQAATTRRVNDVVSLFVDHYAQGTTIDQVLQVDAAFLRDTAVNMLFAGRDTTASALMWCVLMANRNPKATASVRNELSSLLPRLVTDPEYVPDLEDMEQLLYLEAFVRETLRLYPITPFNAREANRDTTLSDGTFIPKGTRVQIPSYALGRMTHVWGPDAAEFKPERWIEVDTSTNKRTLRQVSAFQFPAFHAGPRICIGMRFAILELKTALAYVLSKYELKTVDKPESYTYGISLTLVIKAPIMVTVHPAPTAAAA